MTAISWRGGWVAADNDDRLAAELARELSSRHPLSPLSPVIIGRCLACDDVVAALSEEGTLAVIHLTWSSGTETSPVPSHEVMTVGEFVERFLEHGEHG